MLYHSQLAARLQRNRLRRMGYEAYYYYETGGMYRVVVILEV